MTGSRSQGTPGQRACCTVCGNEPPGNMAALCPYCGTPLPAQPVAGAVQANAHGTVNLESGRPRVLQAMARLERAMAEASRCGWRLLTVIHGYGSSGSGGAIREEIRRLLPVWQETGRIVAFIPGESFTRRSIGRDLWRRYPDLASHPDLGRRNPGITLLLR